MKLTKILQQVLQETGETTNVKTYTTHEQSRQWYTDSDDDEDNEESTREEITKVIFTTDSKTEYRVTFEKTDKLDNNNWMLTVGFAAKTQDDWNYRTFLVVNQGELYRVMATVVKAINNEIEQSKAKGQHIAEILIEPSKNFDNDERRANLYLAYIKANMPAGSKVTMSADKEEIRVLLPQNN